MAHLFSLSNTALSAGWMISSIAVLVYAALILVLAVQFFRQPSGSRSSTPIAGIVFSLIGGLLAALIAYGTSILGDERRPESNLGVFVERVTFGVPPLPTNYLTQPVTEKGLDADLGDLIKSDEEFVFSQEEADKITTIARASGQAEGIAAGVGYSGKEIARYLKEAMLAYSDYKGYPPRYDSLAKYLDSVTDNNRREGMTKFFDVLSARLDNSPLISAAVGSAAKGDFEFPEIGETNLVPQVAAVRAVAMNKGILQVEFTGWILMIESDTSEDSERAKMAKRFYEALKYGQTRTLACFFREASKRFATDTPELKRYVEAWDSALQTRKGSRVRLQVTVSNLSKYDSFIRNVGIIGIGSKSESVAPVLLEVEATATNTPSPFLRIPTRAAESFVFTARLTGEQQDQVFSAYKSGLTYLRIALQASIGESESVVPSPVTPFSQEASNFALKRIRNYKLTLSK